MFCRICGYRFQGDEKDVSEGATVSIRPESLASVPVDADPADTLRPGLAPSAAPAPQVSQPVAGTPAYGQAINPGIPPQQGAFFAQPVPPPAQGSGYAPQPAPQYGQQYQGQGAYGAMPVVPAPAPVYQRAFAGKGTPVRHQSWLLENRQVQPQVLNHALIGNIQKQGVMGVTIETEHLREGVSREERDYVRVRYGSSAVFVYMAPMGRNLYISRTSTVQQSYSKVRIAVFAALAVLMLLSLLFYSLVNPSLPDLISGNVTGGTYWLVERMHTFFAFAFNGLLLFFLIVLGRSVVSWLTEQDFLAILRPGRLHDFSLDALSSIEQTTDKALRITLQEAGLDADAISLSQASTPQQVLYR